MRADGRANPNQLVVSEATLPALASLRQALVTAHTDRFGAQADADLLVGLQLTHSGRWAKPSRQGPARAPDRLCASRTSTGASRGALRVLTDEDLDRLVDDFVAAARRPRPQASASWTSSTATATSATSCSPRATGPAATAGASRTARDSCARSWPASAPRLPVSGIGVRLSAFDDMPWRKGGDGVGVPEGDGRGLPRRLRPASRASGSRARSTTAASSCACSKSLGVRLVCVTAGSPYYNPHIQRPALFPPSDGYLPPEDPLRGVARQIAATARLKAAFPGLVIVGSAYSYLQE